MKGEEEKTTTSVEIGSETSSIDHCTASADSTIIENSNRMNENQNQNQNQNGSTSLSPSTESAAIANTSNGKKAKSCKGCLYYSSHFKANSRNPICVGFTRSFQNVSENIVGQSEMEASKEGRSLTDFRYGCAGYSLYMDQKEQTSDRQGAQTGLPICVGLEVLIDRRVNATDSASSPQIHTKEDGNEVPQRRTHTPAHSTGNEFMSRFARSANVVANGVAKNARKTGNRIKQNIDDMLLPYRRRPK